MKLSSVYRCLQCTLCLCSFYLLYRGSLTGLLLLPLILIELLIRHYVRKPLTVLVVTLFIVQMCVFWGVLKSDFWQQNHSNDVWLNDISNRVKLYDPSDVDIGGFVESIGLKRFATNNSVFSIVNSNRVTSPVRLTHLPAALKILNSTHLNEVIENRDERVLTLALIREILDDLPNSSYPDLKYRTPAEVRQVLSGIFSELPSDGWEAGLKNPCWRSKERIHSRGSDQKSMRGGRGDNEQEKEHEQGENNILHCLPYVYILGQPKCGSSDLYTRVSRHPDVYPPLKKEIRFFTRGEFRTTLSSKDIIDSSTSIYDFTSAFVKAAVAIERDPLNGITLDGGPHTLWWPTQSPDGSLRPMDIPPAQILREVQPDARFLITLTDPVHRMYSDYYFLNDDRRVARYRPDVPTSKSAEEFHVRATEQVIAFQECVASALPAGTEGLKGNWFRASQECAHDRYRFGKAGHGRLGIGLYVLFLEKWLEHFSPDQFLVVRLEDYATDPQGYMEKIFRFLNLPLPTTGWEKILGDRIANQHHNKRDTMLAKTDHMLREFYRPYNTLLATVLQDKGFLWEGSEQIDRNRTTKVLQKEQVLRNYSEVEHSVLDQHGPGRLRDRPIFDIDDTANEERRPKSKSRLRGAAELASKEEDNLQPLDLHPGSLDLVGLPRAENAEFNEFVRHLVVRGKPTTPQNASLQICAASLGMDYAALEYLLYDVGLSASRVDERNLNNSPLHCLANVYLFGEATSRSHVFNLLKGRKSWVSDLLDPPLALHMKSVRSQDIKDALATRIEGTFKWLQRAGADINGVNTEMDTPLHYASLGGLVGLVHLLLQHGANPNAQNQQGKTPLHYASVYGHVAVASLLVQHGGDMYIRDVHTVRPFDVISNPGVISPSDALKHFNITQRSVRGIGRVIHPELRKEFWPAGDGGYGVERLPGYEDDMQCDVDQYWAHEISGKEIFETYLARSAPILIRGLVDDWPAVEAYNVENLRNVHGDETVQVSSIPYSTKFGGDGMTRMPLAQYINEMRAHNITGGPHPWYVFQGTPLRNAPPDSSLVAYNRVPTPPTIAEAMHYVNMGRNYMTTFRFEQDKKVESRRKNFVNAQWALGGEGTGAPVHHHNTAWNAMMYGAKKWFLYPPHDMIMSNMQILEYIESDLKSFEARGIKPLTCVQTAGDVLIVPESWGHGVLNVQESVAVATESRSSMWRLQAKLPVMKSLPDNNRETHQRRTEAKS